MGALSRELRCHIDSVCAGVLKPFSRHENEQKSNLGIVVYLDVGRIAIVGKKFTYKENSSSTLIRLVSRSSTLSSFNLIYERTGCVCNSNRITAVVTFISGQTFQKMCSHACITQEKPIHFDCSFISAISLA